jgi:hypothetical protein
MKENYRTGGKNSIFRKIVITSYIETKYRKHIEKKRLHRRVPEITENSFHEKFLLDYID